MLYSLYDFDQELEKQGPDSVLNILNNYAKLKLLNPASEKFLKLDQFKDYYRTNERTLVRNIKDNLVSRTDAILFSFCSETNSVFELFGELISCSSFITLKDRMSSEQEFSLRTGLAKERFESVIEHTLKYIIDHTQEYSDWIQNHNFIRFVLRKYFVAEPRALNYSKITKKATFSGLEFLTDAYNQLNAVNAVQEFNNCLKDDHFIALSALTLPRLQVIDFSACANTTSLRYILDRITKSETFTQRQIPIVFKQVLSVPGKNRLRELNLFFLTALNDQIAQKKNSKLWIESFLAMSEVADLRTTHAYFKALFPLLEQVPLETLFVAFIKRGVLFYNGCLALLEKHTSDALDTIDTNVYLEHLPYLRDAQSLREALTKETYSKTQLQALARVCCSLKYDSIDVCESQTSFVIGIAMFEVITKFLAMKELPYRNYIHDALLYGSGSIVEYLFEKSQLPIIDRIEGIEDVVCSVIEVSLDTSITYYINDIKKIRYCVRMLGIQLDIISERIAADVDDNVEKLKKFLAIYKAPNIQNMTLVAGKARNYKILYYLLSF